LIFDAERFGAIRLREETGQLLGRDPQGDDLRHLNRLLLEDAYPLEISRMPDAMDRLLTLMLSLGVNWMAEARWLTSARAWIMEYYQEAGQHWTDRRNKRLRRSLPLISAMAVIAEGFPTEANHATPPPLFDQELLQPRGLLLVSPGAHDEHLANGVGFHGFVYDREHRIMRIHVCGGAAFTTAFQYHDQMTIHDAHGNPRRFRLQVNEDAIARAFFVDNMPGAIEALALQPADHHRLEEIFARTLTLSAGAIGSAEDRSLGHLFAICAEGFRELAAEDETQVNRLTIYQLAIINRLHAWLGWNGATAYPAGWPLSNPLDYDFICAIASQVWQSPACRKALSKDMVPIEWMLAWFHLD